MEIEWGHENANAEGSDSIVCKDAMRERSSTIEK